ncbi:MAG TPA: hypothetical protein ACFCUD_14835 [Cyclobacteriaceae bacterium]
MIDTLSLSKELQEAGIRQNEADAIAHSMGKLMDSNLASRENIKSLELKIEQTKADLQEKLRQLDVKIEETKADLQEKLHQLDVKIEQTKADLQKDIIGIDVKIEQTKADLQKEIRIVSYGTVKWVAGMLIGQTALLFTLIKLFGGS